MLLPESYVNMTSTIAINLNDGLDESIYYLSVMGRPFIEPPPQDEEVS